MGQSKKTKLERSENHWLLVMLPILGISFWFLLAFPLADRNESYIWITYLEQYSFLEIIQNPIPSVRTFRPVAQAFAWGLYHLSGGNGVLIQGINFVLLCAAIWVVIPLTPASRNYDVRLFHSMIGLIYFPAFYYIFNLHGMFYSFILLFIALMLKEQGGIISNWKKWLPISILLAFFHPLIPIFYAAYMIGWLFEKQLIKGNKIISSAAILMLLALVMQLLLPFPIISVIDVQNLLGTMNNVETYIIIKGITLCLCFLTLSNKTRQQQALLSTLIIVYLPLAIIYKLPILLLLALLIEVSLIIEKKWSLAGLVAVAFFFSLAVGSGAPTKACIFVFLLPYILLRTSSFSFVNKIGMAKVTSLAVLTAIICCSVLIRLEIKITFLSPLIRPLLVEKGKTYQLEEALVLAEQEIPQRRITFLQEKQSSIRDRGQPKERDNFPPARQKELDTYQNYKLSEQSLSSLPVWYIAFGTEVPNDTLSLVHILNEKNCNPAYVYEAAHFLPVRKN